MNSRLPMLLVAAAAWGTPLLGQGSFEGTVTYRLTDTAGKTITMVYQAKGTKIRMDMSGGAGMDAVSPALISDQSTREVTAMIVQAHISVASSMDSLPKPTVGKPDVKPTGTHETIAGVPC